MGYELPHRLSFLATNYCDICHTKQDATSSVRIPGNSSMFGWEVCSSQECITTAKNWSNKSSIPESTLKQIFGQEIAVMRSSGVLQYGWQITGNAFINIDPTPEWFVKVRFEQYKKIVTIEELELWNQTLFPYPSN